MPVSKAPPIQADLESLSQPFQDQAREVVSRLAAKGLPMVVFETRRATARQDWLADRGYSHARGATGPHPWGLAMDMVLDIKSPYWAGVGQWPMKGEGGAAWDTGYELRRGAWPSAGPGATGDRLVCVRPAVAAVWRAYGAEAMALGLTWGGNQADKAWASKVPGAELGWDCGHVQAAAWLQRTKDLPRPA